MSNEGEPEPPSASSAVPMLCIRPRRELFEHGLLPIPKLIFTDGTLTLAPLKQRLLQRSPNGVVPDPQTLADELQIPTDHARLALDSLASVLAGDRDPTAGVNVNDLVLFLYVQSYKRLVPRSHKDPAAVADVWPSTSAFDGYLSALSPIQVGISYNFIDFDQADCFTGVI